MRAEDNLYSFLGFDQSERRVFQAVSPTGGMSVSEISRRTRLPRTTAKEITHRLHTRGWLRKSTKAGHTLWRKTSQATIERRFTSIARRLKPIKRSRLTASKKHQTLFASDTTDIKALHGTREIMGIYERAYMGEPYERVLLTECASGFRHVRKKIPLSYLNTLNELAAQHKNILEIIANEATREEYAKLAHADERWIQHAAKRMIDIAIIPNTVLPDEDSELLIFRDTIMLTDWNEETAILVKNASLARMMKAFFKATKSQGESFDNASFLRLLEQTVAPPTRS